MENKIEHLIKHPQTQTKETPIMLMHGAWHGAWCWENWMNYFAELGYEVHAISLPGHGHSGMSKRHINLYTLGDYAEVLAAEIENLERPPIVVGHSMGGAVVQRYLENHIPAAAVLLATLPNQGTLPTLLRLYRNHPWPMVKLTTLFNTYHLVASNELTQANFFSPTAEVDIAAWQKKLVRESFLAINQGHFPFADARKAACPVMVLAGEKDSIFTVEEERQTAARYKAKFIVYKDQAHNLMAEPQWRQVADDIHEWVTNELGLT